MSTFHSESARRATVLATGALALGLLVPAAASARRSPGIDPSAYQSGVPADRVEHGVYIDTTVGALHPERTRYEFWISGSRFREEITDLKTGRKIRARVHDASGTTAIRYNKVAPPAVQADADESIPGPGQPAPYGTKVLTGRVTIQPSGPPLVLTYQPIGSETVAGFAGTRYEVLVNGSPWPQELGTDPANPTHTYLVLEKGTHRPLRRDTVGPKSPHGLSFHETLKLVSRETTRSKAALARLSTEAIERTVAGWKRRAAGERR